MNIYPRLILLITFISFLGIRQSLSFALNGDDWLALWRYIKDFTTFQSHFAIKNFSTDYNNYVFANMIMGMIYRLFLFNPFPYYLISLLFRITAALSFYPAIFAATGDKLAATLSSIFFSSMFAGIETTNWVFNMNTYVSIALFNLFLYLYYSSETKVLSKRGILNTLILTSSFIITQNRMHGLLFIIPLLILSKIKKFDIKNLKTFFARTFFFFLPIFSYRLLTRSSNDISYSDSFIQSFGHLNKLISSIFSSIANSIIPEKIFTSLNITDGLKAFLVFLLFLSLSLYLIRNLISQKSFFILICLFMPIFFLIVPQTIFDPSIVLPSDHRYLLIPGAYILVAFSIFISTSLRQKSSLIKIMAVSLIIIIISVNLISLKDYFGKLSENGRLAKDSDEQFKFITSQIKESKNNSPLVFLFISDNPFYLYNAITFGFGYHMMLVDKRFSLDIQKAPFVVDGMKSLIDILSSKESKELKRYGYNPVEIPVENLYAFFLQNKNLTNITPEISNYLKEKLPLK